MDLKVYLEPFSCLFRLVRTKTGEGARRMTDLQMIEAECLVVMTIGILFQTSNKDEKCSPGKNMKSARAPGICNICHKSERRRQRQKERKDFFIKPRLEALYGGGRFMTIKDFFSSPLDFT
jgi:hypothetical protein